MRRAPLQLRSGVAGQPPAMQRLLIVDDDRGITEGLAAALEREGREIIVCNDVESAEIVVEQLAPDWILTDARLTGPFRHEGLEFVSTVRRASPSSRVMLMSGMMSDELRSEALRRGAACAFAKPVSVATIEEQLSEPAGNDDAVLTRLQSLDEITASPMLTPHFQTIRSIAVDGEPVFGYESLARFPGGGVFSRPDVLFDYAVRRDAIVDLEIACLMRTFQYGAALPSGTRLFVNLHPAVIGSDRLEAAVSSCAAYGIDPSRVVLEITEHGVLPDAAVVRRVFASLREQGFNFALDDVGIAHSHLMHVSAIRPSFLKVSQEFGSDFERDPSLVKIIQHFHRLAEDFDCQLILEGIESASTLASAKSLGIPLGQGYFFDRPAPVSQHAVN